MIAHKFRVDKGGILSRQREPGTKWATQACFHSLACCGDHCPAFHIKSPEEEVRLTTVHEDKTIDRNFPKTTSVLIPAQPMRIHLACIRYDILLESAYESD